MGVQWFLTGAIFWFGQTLSHGSSFGKFYSFATSFLWCGAIAGAWWGTKKLKENIVAPRAGYVTLREQGVKLRVSAKGVKFDFSSVRDLVVLGLVLLCTLGVLAFFLNRTTERGWWTDNPQNWDWMIGFCIAMLFSVTFGWSAWQYQAPRYWWLAALSLALAGWEYRKTGDPIGDIVAIMTWLGGGMALMGAVRLRAFLQANPRVEDRGQ